MVDISGPHWVNQGEKVTLICRYDLGRDAIYSMKWFKGDQEVYRYVPTDQPEYKYFNSPGIIVDVRSISDQAGYLMLKEVAWAKLKFFRRLQILLMIFRHLA